MNLIQGGVKFFMPDVFTMCLNKDDDDDGDDDDDDDDVDDEVG